MSESIQVLPEQFPSFLALAPATDAAGRTSPYFTLKNTAKAVAWFSITQGNAATVALSVVQARDVAGTGAKAVAGTCRIWAAQDVASEPCASRQSDAASFTTSAATTTKLIGIEIDPAVNFDLAGGYRSIALVTGASNVANVTAGTVQYMPARFAYTGAFSPRVD